MFWHTKARIRNDVLREFERYVQQGFAYNSNEKCACSSAPKSPPRCKHRNRLKVRRPPISRNILFQIADESVENIDHVPGHSSCRLTERHQGTAFAFTLIAMSVLNQSMKPLHELAAGTFHSHAVCIANECHVHDRDDR